MKFDKFSLTSLISLIGTYASYLIPLFSSDKFAHRELILITFFSSIIFLTIFISSIFVKINEFKYEIKSLQNDNDTISLRIKLLKEEKELLKNSFEKPKQ